MQIYIHRTFSHGIRLKSLEFRVTNVRIDTAAIPVLAEDRCKWQSDRGGIPIIHADERHMGDKRGMGDRVDNLEIIMCCAWLQQSESRYGYVQKAHTSMSVNPNLVQFGLRVLRLRMAAGIGPVCMRDSVHFVFEGSILRMVFCCERR